MRGSSATEAPRIFELSDDGESTSSIGPMLGYRFQPWDGGFVLRVLFTPVYTTRRGKVFPAFCLSAGWAF